MPLTFAHPAAILPFSRKSKYVNFLALVLGSMSPDFEYFIYGKPHEVVGHTLTGFLTFNLPLVVIVYIIYQLFIHRTLFNHLPSCLQDTYIEKTDSSIGLKVIVFLYSALFGMLTHVVWDSFTHLGGFIVRNFTVFTYNFHVFSYSIPLYKFLQHGSTVVGIIVIIAYMYYRTAKYGSASVGNSKTIQKIGYWGLIGLFTIVLFCLWYGIDSVSVESYGTIVVRILDSGLIGLLIVSLFYMRLSKKKT